MRKKCFKCKQTKDISLFYAHPKMADKHFGKCKLCTKRDVKNRYNDPEGYLKVIRYELKRKSTLHRKQKTLLYQRKSRIVNKHKWKIWNLINYLKQTGKLKSQPCVKCGNIKTEAHHPDYRKPLYVIWLCRKHHRETHKQNFWGELKILI